MNRQMIKKFLIISLGFVLFMAPCNVQAEKGEETMKKYTIHVQFEDPFVDDLDLARKIVYGERVDNNVLPEITISINEDINKTVQLKFSGNRRTHTHFGKYDFTIQSEDQVFDINFESASLDNTGPDNESFLEFKKGLYLYMYYDIVRRQYRIEQEKISRKYR
ncbi:MAG: hypothetical protein GF384_02995 [Elusimicrobia bacterium]|nr:hypothetical protein [Elusimicrobiota bacterium]